MMTVSLVRLGPVRVEVATLRFQGIPVEQPAGSVRIPVDAHRRRRPPAYC
jgi:hypothetical protein